MNSDKKIKTVDKKLNELYHYMKNDYKRPKEHENKINLNLIKKHNFNYNFLVGGRSIGKTTTLQIEELLLDISSIKREQFLKITRFDKQLKTKNVNWIKKEVHNILNLFGLDVIYYSNKYLIGHSDLILEGKRRPKSLFFEDCVIWGYSGSINNYMDLRESDFPKVSKIIEEEFAIYGEDGYIVDEVKKFMDIVSTVNRDRNNVKVYFIGNTMEINNPYFEYFGIDASLLESGHLYCFTQETEFKQSATVGLYFYGMSYQNEEEIPIILRVKNNKLATSINKYELPKEIINENDWLIEILKQDKFDEFYYLHSEIVVSIDTTKKLIYENDKYKFDSLTFVIISEIYNKNNIYIIPKNQDFENYGLMMNYNDNLTQYKLDNDIRNSLPFFDVNFFNNKNIIYGSVDTLNIFKKWLK